MWGPRTSVFVILRWLQPLCWFVFGDCDSFIFGFRIFVVRLHRHYPTNLASNSPTKNKYEDERETNKHAKFGVIVPPPLQEAMDQLPEFGFVNFGTGPSCGSSDFRRPEASLRDCFWRGVDLAVKKRLVFSDTPMSRSSIALHILYFLCESSRSI